jgi:butyryl-CoA dehydrogenase
MAAGESRAVLANATHYMSALSTLAVAWLWLWMADAASRNLALDDGFRAGKRQACRFWFATEFAQVEHAARLVGDVDRSALDMQSGWF